MNQIQKELAGKSGGSPVFIFGNGPSLQLFDLSKTKNSVTIASNAFIKNSAAISACELNFIVASDAAVYFGPSTLAKLFLNDLSERLSSNNHLFFVYPLNFHQILHFNIPASLHSQLIPVPRYNNKSLTALRDHFELTDIGNTLNTILLPLSLLFSKTIILVGFDGIGSPAVKGSVTANYQWSYSDAFSYGTYSKSTRLFEPGFTNEHKKMIDNGTYTDIYFGNDFENNLAHLEDQGYQIFSVNRSTVPSIEKRFNPILAENYLAH
ncbi:MAG: hypothetical protein HUU10_09425 [Bacteroidetes bacterium]|nr:hypothetical protein [Bacteroidota bacterium]